MSEIKGLEEQYQAGNLGDHDYQRDDTSASFFLIQPCRSSLSISESLTLILNPRRKIGLLNLIRTLILASRPITEPSLQLCNLIWSSILCLSFPKTYLHVLTPKELGLWQFDLQPPSRFSSEIDLVGFHVPFDLRCFLKAMKMFEDLVNLIKMMLRTKLKVRNKLIQELEVVGWLEWRLSRLVPCG